MPVEELLEEIYRQRKIISEAQKKQDELIERLAKSRDVEWDWISVKEASNMLKVSFSTVYRFIDTGKIRKVRHVGGKKFVSRKEVSEIDDKYEYGGL